MTDLMKIGAPLKIKKDEFKEVHLELKEKPEIKNDIKTDMEFCGTQEIPVELIEPLVLKKPIIEEDIIEEDIIEEDIIKEDIIEEDIIEEDIIEEDIIEEDIIEEDIIEEDIIEEDIIEEDIILDFSSLIKKCTFYLNHEYNRYNLKKKNTENRYIDKFKEYTLQNKHEMEYKKFKILENKPNITTQEIHLKININIDGEEKIINIKDTFYFDENVIYLNQIQFKNILLIIRQFEIKDIYLMDDEIINLKSDDETVLNNCDIFWNSAILNKTNVLKCFDECLTCVYKDICQSEKNTDNYYKI